jgi:hypothetical protein
MYALADQAASRMTAMDASNASFLGSTCGGGSGNARVLCAATPSNPRCSPAVLAQASRWAVASNILKITPDTLPAVIANVTLWRGSADWHTPAMYSPQVIKGWGYGGAISFKVMPCSAIPAPLVAGTAYACDTLDPATGKPAWDEGFSFWSNYKSTSPVLQQQVLALKALLKG